jgi:hypothetical protein
MHRASLDDHPLPVAGYRCGYCSHRCRTLEALSTHELVCVWKAKCEKAFEFLRERHVAWLERQV